MIDEAKLHTFIGQILGDLAGAYSVSLVRLGDRLGLYKALHGAAPMTSRELADKASVDERYLREWLSHHAASGYLTYDPASARFAMSEEQAMVFANEDSPVYIMGAFDVAAATFENEAKVEPAFRNGGGVAWGDQAGCLFCAVGRFFRPGYHNNLVAQWLPALQGVVGRLESGAKVADVGCGHGWSTVMMGKAFPRSQFVGYDFHEGSIAQARRHAVDHGVEGNVRFEVSKAKELPDSGFDLIACFDCLHDMGDPRGAATQIHKALKPDGTWMIVEPMAKDRLEDNYNPVSRICYAASTLICVPTSLAQEVGTALGAQAGEARIRDVATSAGFQHFRRATETPFNMVFEARP